MRRLVILFAAGLLAAPAVAQTANETPIDNMPARDDASVEKMLSDAERDRAAAQGNDDVSRAALAEWAGCLARKNSAEAGRVLAMDFTTPTYGRAFKMLTEEDKRCREFRGTLRTQRLLLAGELAEALIEQSRAPVVNTLAKAAIGPPTPAFSFTDRVAICVVRSVPSDVAKLFATERNSSDETAAVQTLATPAGMCAKAAGATKEGMGAFFEEYLIPGAKAFVSRRWPTASEAIGLIREAGGTPVLAHPFWDIDEPSEVQALIEDLDVDGVEVFYPDHDRAQTEFLVNLCGDRGLAATASSDFHGPNHKMFSTWCSYETFDLGVPELPPQHAGAER